MSMRVNSRCTALTQSIWKAFTINRFTRPIECGPTTRTKMRSCATCSISHVASAIVIASESVVPAWGHITPPIAFRHPDAVSHLISLSGSFDISSLFDGYHEDNIYFNSPYEYLPNMPDPWKYNHMGIVLGTGEWDNTRHESYRLSEILNSKGIKHWLDDGKWRGHEWSYWRDMLPYYLSKIV